MELTERFYIDLWTVYNIINEYEFECYIFSRFKMKLFKIIADFLL